MIPDRPRFMHIKLPVVIAGIYLRRSRRGEVESIVACFKAGVIPDVSLTSTVRRISVQAAIL